MGPAAPVDVYKNSLGTIGFWEGGGPMWPIVLCPAHEQPDQRNCNWCKSWFVVAPSNSHHLLFCTLVRVDHNTNAFGCLGAFWKANFGTVVMASVYRF